MGRRKIILMFLLLVFLAGCAAPRPAAYVAVKNPNELNLVKQLQSGQEWTEPIKIAVFFGDYSKISYPTQEQIAFAQQISNSIVAELRKCPNKYVITQNFEESDFTLYLPVIYLGRSKDRAYQGAIPISSMRALAEKPGEMLAQSITRQMMGQAVRNGAGVASVLFIAYDVGRAAVDGIQAIGHLYGNIQIKMIDHTLRKVGQTPQIFETRVAFTIDLDSDDREADIAKSIPEITQTFLPLFVDEKCISVVSTDIE